MKKQLTVCFLAVLTVLALTACGASSAPPDLTGRWEQSHDETTSFYQIAEITDDAIRVWWHLTADDSEYLYWTGSFVPPETGGRTYTWESVNDSAEARTSSWARREETMSFTYRNGKLGYIVFMGNLRMSVTLEMK